MKKIMLAILIAGSFHIALAMQENTSLSSPFAVNGDWLCDVSRTAYTDGICDRCSICTVKVFYTCREQVIRTCHNLNTGEEKVFVDTNHLGCIPAKECK